MRTIVKYLFLLLVATCLLSTVSFGQKLPEIEICEFGIYTSETAVSIRDDNVPSGARRIVRNIELVERTSVIPCLTSDKCFGVRYKIDGEPNGAVFELEIRKVFPSPGKWDNFNNEYITQYSYFINRKLGDLAFTAIALSDAKNLIPGRWKIQLLVDDTVLAEKAFTLMPQR